MFVDSCLLTRVSPGSLIIFLFMCLCVLIQPLLEPKEDQKALCKYKYIVRVEQVPLATDSSEPKDAAALDSIEGEFLVIYSCRRVEILLL